MKKGLFIIILSLIAASCATYRLDLSKLTTGMTKEEVKVIVGSPDRVLAVNRTENGLQEVLEYRTLRDEVYALEFWNDHLTGYEFLYEDVDYLPPLYPPAWYPDYGRPVYHPIYIKEKPNRPERPTRPTRPGNTSRPQPSRPSPDRSNLTKPATEAKPSTTNPSNARPSTREEHNRQERR